MPNHFATQFAVTAVAHRKPDSVYVGFCNDSNTLKRVSGFLQTLDGVYKFVDPIMGDNGKLYPVFNNDYVQTMKNAVRGADCITPNVTEACLLVGVDYDSLRTVGCSAALEKCMTTFADFVDQVGVNSAVITGVDCGKRIANIVLLRGVAPFVVFNDRVKGIFSGTGDVFSSVLLGKLLNGVSLADSVDCAANFVQQSLVSTQCEDKRFGTEFCRVLDKLN